MTSTRLVNVSCRLSQSQSPGRLAPAGAPERTTGSGGIPTVAKVTPAGTSVDTEVPRNPMAEHALPRIGLRSRF